MFGLEPGEVDRLELSDYALLLRFILSSDFLKEFNLTEERFRATLVSVSQRSPGIF